MQNKSRAFTLIELLVVVLIIGILAAVAVPQYQKAVIKSRYARIKNLTKNLAEAEELYYMANGDYTYWLEQLAVMPEGKLNSSTGSRFDYDWGSCAFKKDGGTIVYCVNSTDQIYYQIYLLHSSYLPGGRKCSVREAASLSDIRNDICKAETGATTYEHSGTEYWWTYR